VGDLVRSPRLGAAREGSLQARVIGNALGPPLLEAQSQLSCHSVATQSPPSCHSFAIGPSPHHRIGGKQWRAATARKKVARIAKN